MAERIQPPHHSGRTAPANPDIVDPDYQELSGCREGRTSGAGILSGLFRVPIVGLSAGIEIGACTRVGAQHFNEDLGSWDMVSDTPYACSPRVCTLRRGNTCRDSSQGPPDALCEYGQLQTLSAEYFKSYNQSSVGQKQTVHPPAPTVDALHLSCPENGLGCHKEKIILLPRLDHFAGTMNLSNVERSRPPSTLCALQDSFIEPLSIRVTCPPTTVVLPPDVQRRYRRFDSETEEEYLDIPFVSFCTRGFSRPMESDSSGGQFTMVFSECLGRRSPEPGSAVPPPRGHFPWEKYGTQRGPASLSQVLGGPLSEGSNNRSFFSRGLSRPLTRRGTTQHAEASRVGQEERGTESEQRHKQGSDERTSCWANGGRTKVSHHYCDCGSPVGNLDAQEIHFEAREQASGAAPFEIDRASLACHSFSVGDPLSPVSHCLSGAASSEPEEENKYSFFTHGAFSPSGMTKRLKCLSSLQAEQRVSRNPAKCRDIRRVSPYAPSSRTIVEPMGAYCFALPRNENPGPVEKWQMLAQGEQSREPQQDSRVPCQLQPTKAPVPHKYANHTNLHECSAPTRSVSAESTAAVSRSSQSEHGENDLQPFPPATRPTGFLSRLSHGSPFDEAIMAIFTRIGRASTS